MRKMLSRLSFFTFDRLLTALVFLAIVVACGLTPMQTDTWWQLRAGRDMWLSRSVLLTDVYSHTAYGTFWPNHEWLAEVVFYGLLEAGGLPLLTLFAAGLIVGGWSPVLAPRQRARSRALHLGRPCAHPVKSLVGAAAACLLPPVHRDHGVPDRERPHVVAAAGVRGVGERSRRSAVGLRAPRRRSGCADAPVAEHVASIGPGVSRVRARRDRHATRTLLLVRDPEVPRTHPSLPAGRVAPAARDGHPSAAVLDPRGSLPLWARSQSSQAAPAAA